MFTFTIHFETRSGYPAEMQVTGDTWGEIKASSRQLIDQLAALGATPQQQRYPATASVEQPREDWCPIHQVEMEKRTNGKGSWYSHIAPDGHGAEYWCKGR